MTCKKEIQVGIPPPKRTHWEGLFLVFPLVVFLGIFLFYPLLRLLALSLFDPAFTLKHFGAIFKNAVYLRVLGNTIRVSLTVTSLLPGVWLSGRIMLLLR